MIQRIATSITVAFPITFLLLFLMQLLISTGKTPISDRLKIQIPQILIISPESEPIKKQQRLLPPPPVPIAPEFPKTNIENPGPGLIPVLITPPPPMDRRFKIVTSMSDADFAPIVRVNPIYPNRARTRGIEGFVVVEYTVNRTGSVANARVVRSTNPVFERAALHAVNRWRYKPRIVNNEAVNVTGIQTKLSFRLDE